MRRHPTVKVSMVGLGTVRGPVGEGARLERAGVLYGVKVDGSVEMAIVPVGELGRGERGRERGKEGKREREREGEGDGGDGGAYMRWMVWY